MIRESQNNGLTIPRTVVFLALSLLGPTTAGAVNIAVDLHAGSLGAGVGASLGLSSHFNLRVGINSAELEVIDIEDEDGLDYQNPNLSFDNQYLFIDWFPSARSQFRLTAGAVLNNNEITATATVDGDGQLVGGVEAPIGTGVSGNIYFEDTAGYLGIGWGNAFGFKRRFNIGFDIGVLLQGSPQVALAVNDPTNTITDADVEMERQDLEAEIKDIDLWPVVTFSVGVAF